MANFTHFNQDGEAIMVDVSQKDITMRIAIAEGSIKVNQEVFRSIKEQTNKKGDVLAVARIAGIMAAKKTSDMIPLCHPLFITKVTIDFELDEDNYMIKAIATTKVNGKTGVEMEALHAVSVTLLTIYDMCKAMDRAMEITDVHLEHKEGGKSGIYDRKERKKPLAGRPKPRRKCERKTTRSPSCGTGEISVSGGTRALTKATLGIRHVSRRKEM